jgi:preprotein translocase subunit SecY
MLKNEYKYPKGYWMAVGISIGVAIGVAMGPIFDNFGVGIGIGIAIGSGIGASLERKNKDNIRPLTEQEQKRQKLGVVIGLALVGVLLLALIIAYFLVGR